jgi:hypothetical protein
MQTGYPHVFLERDKIRYFRVLFPRFCGNLGIDLEAAHLYLKGSHFQRPRSLSMIHFTLFFFSLSLSPLAYDYLSD